MSKKIKYPCPYCGANLEEELFSQESITATFRWQIIEPEKGDPFAESIAETQNDIESHIDHHYCGACREEIGKEEFDKLGLDYF